MEVRAAQTGEGDLVGEVITAAFADGGHVAALWADVVARGLDRADLVAVDDTGVIGHVGLSHAWLDAAPRLVDVLVLSPLSVRPTHQGRGVGAALVAAAVRAADGLGAPSVFLEGDPRYYSRLGFERASSRGFESPSRRTPDPAFQVVVLPAHEGWMTGRVVYREVWWEHDAAGLR